MNSLDASDLLRLHLTDNWDEVQTPISFLNEDFTKPKDSPWISFTVVPNETLSQTLGSKGGRKFRRMGVILFQAFTPLYSASYAGMKLCEDIISLFEGENIHDIWCYKSNYKPTGTSGGFYQFNGSIFYRFDEKK